MLQDDCRNQCALIWQIYLAISTPSNPTAPIASSSTSPHNSSSNTAEISMTNLASPNSSTKLFPRSQSQINLASKTQSPLHVRVAGLMCENNQDSLDLIYRYESN